MSNGARLLLIDDDVNLVNVIRLVCTAKGYEFHAAHSAAEGLEKIVERRVGRNVLGFGREEEFTAREEREDEEEGAAMSMSGMEAELRDGVLEKLDEMAAEDLERGQLRRFLDLPGGKLGHEMLLHEVGISGRAALIGQTQFVNNVVHFQTQGMHTDFFGSVSPKHR